MFVILTGALGYIFSGFIKKPTRDPYAQYLKKGFDWENIKYAAIIAGPAVILHELGHKFVAIALGFQASFQIYWMGLGLGVILKLISSPFLILAPAYVTIPAGIPPLESSLIAFAGPFINLVLWLGSAYLLKYKKLKKNTMYILALTKRINMILFFFNLIPVPPLDGYKVLSGLIEYFKIIF